MASYMGHEYDAPQNDKACRYRVGDRVRFTDEVEPGWWFKAGQFGVISQSEGGSINVDVDGGAFHNPAYVSDIHLQPAFRPGDRVKLNRHSNLHAYGDRGTVKRAFGENVEVRMDLRVFDSRFYTFPAEYLDWERAEDAVANVATAQAPDCAVRKVEQDNEPVKPQPKFKAGDRVTFFGNECEVDLVRVENDGSYRYRINGHCWTQACFLTPAPCPQDNERAPFRWGVQDTAIVALTKNGQPLPSHRPHVHASAADATREAERLARANPGQEFAVYQRVAGRVAEVHVNMKEVA